MPAPTQGFSLSALPRSPNIPDKIGQIDVRAIYDGVKQGLSTFEAVRTAPKSMALADATMDSETALAPLKPRMALAQTEGVEQQTPIKTALLAEELRQTSDPAMIEAKRQALLNKNVRQPTGAIQVVNALTAAKERLRDDQNDTQAALIVSTLQPIADRMGMAPVEAQNARTADTNATRVATTAMGTESREATNAATNATQRDIAGQNISSREKIASAGNVRAENVANIGAQGRINAAKAQFTGKIYETQAEKADKIQEDLAAVDLLDQKVEAYKNSFLGAGPIVGSGLMTTARTIFGDPTGADLAAAASLSMRGAIDKMRGLGAMSEKEYNAAIAELPLKNDPAEVLDTKMIFIKSVRNWIAARNSLFLQRLETGDSPMQAHSVVRRSIPLMLPNGTIADPETTAANLAAGQAGITLSPAAKPDFQSLEEANAAGARGEIPNGKTVNIMIEGKVTPKVWRN